MKIRKFNESLDKIDTEYIDECFVELSDMGYNFVRDNEMYELIIPIYEENDDNVKCNDVEFVNRLERAYNISLMLQECIEKVKTKYPDIVYTLSFGYQGGDSTNIDLWFEIDKSLWV